MENKTVYRTGRTFKEEDRVDTYISVKHIGGYVDELLKETKQRLTKKFEPFVSFNSDGGFLEIYWKDNPCYAEDCENRHLTLMKDMETHEVVGIKIHGVHKLLNLTEIP